MIQDAYETLRAMAAQPHAQERTCEYLAGQFSRFMKKGDTVLICFPQQGYGSLSHLMEQAVLLCEAVPVVWDADHRWKKLLRLAFSSHADIIIATPLIVLGLAKLRSFYCVPLFIRNVVTAGYPCEEWMIDGIRRGFDCVTRGCLSMGISGVVAGFSCDTNRGIHIRDDVYGIELLDEAGNPVSTGEEGEIVIFPLENPDFRYFTGENGRMRTGICSCGSDRPLLVNIRPGRTENDRDLFLLGKTLQSWSSVLDCRLRRGDYGLEIEAITLPGGRIPPLPSAAKRNIRVFDPEIDEPFLYDPARKISEIVGENH